MTIFVDTDKFAKVQFAAGGTVLKTDVISNPIAKNVKVYLLPTSFHNFL